MGVVSTPGPNARRAACRRRHRRRCHVVSVTPAARDDCSCVEVPRRPLIDRSWYQFFFFPIDGHLFSLISSEC